MKEEQSRLLVEHVAMDGGHVDAVRPQRLDDWIHLIAGKNEISGDSRLATTGRLEVNCNRHAHWPDWAHLHSAFHDRIATRHVELIDAAVGLSFGANQLVELRSVEIDRGCRTGCGGG